MADDKKVFTDMSVIEDNEVVIEFVTADELRELFNKDIENKDE